MKVDIRGKYIPIRTIKTQGEWEKVIEAFVALGAVEWEGREGKSEHNYSDIWPEWSFVGVNEGVEVVHYDREESYSGEGYDVEEITKEYLFSLVESGGVIEDKVSSLAKEGADAVQSLLDWIDGLPEDVISSSYGIDRDWLGSVVGELKELGKVNE